MNLFRRKQKQKQTNKEQSQETRKIGLWSHRNNSNLQGSSSDTSATSSVTIKNRQQSNHDKASGRDSLVVSAPKGHTKAREHGENGLDTDIWSRAYDSLKTQSKDLVIEYEELLSTRSPTYATSGLPNEGKPRNVIEQKDPQKRKMQMDEMMKAGQSRLEEKRIKHQFFGKEHVLDDDIASAVNVVLLAKDWIGEALRFSPEASLIWAGVSVVLPLLTNPSTSNKANSEGFEYVTSRMRYYVEFEKCLLPDRQDTHVSERLRNAFESHVEYLYQHILEFQIRSILRLYRRRLGKLRKRHVSTRGVEQDDIRYQGS